MSQKNTRFVFRNEIDILGNRLMMENMNTRKEAGVKLLNAYRTFRAIKPKLNLRNPLVNILIVFECGNYFLNEYIKTDNTFVKYWRQNNKVDYIWNSGIYFTLGRILYLANKSLCVSILPMGLTFNFLDYKYIVEYDKKLSEHLKIDNINIVSQKNIIPKLFLAFSLTNLMSYVFKKKVWTLKLLIFNRQNFTMFFGLFFIAKLLKYLSYITSQSVE
jgi:hypothetical protein